MASRRQLFSVAAAALGLTPIVAWLGRSEPVIVGAAADGRFPTSRTDAQWRASLTGGQYYVLRDRGTEPAFSSTLNTEKRHGTFVCAACDRPLFSSAAKYDSRTGWPSFWAPLEHAIGTSADRSFFMVRTEVHCAGCGSHLGHVFPDGPKPTGLRYCMNGVAMTFIADA